jgi:hypothetical protein
LVTIASAALKIPSDDGPVPLMVPELVTLAVPVLVLMPSLTPVIVAPALLKNVPLPTSIPLSLPVSVAPPTTVTVTLVCVPLP